MKLILRKLGNALVAQDRMAVDDIEKIRHGDLVICEVGKPRSLPMHRKFFALVRATWKACDQERYPSEDDLRAALLISAGHRTRLELPGGEVCYVPKSIAFDKLDQLQFQAVFENACDAVAMHILPGIEREDLRREIEDLIGVAA